MAIWLRWRRAFVDTLERLNLAFPKVDKARLEEIKAVRAALLRETDD